MGAIGFVFKAVCREIGGRILPNGKDFATALVLTVFFGLLCEWNTMGYVVFFAISLALVYAVARIARAIKVLLQLRKMKKNVSGLVDGISCAFRK